MATSERWAHQVVEVKPRLVQLGLQGWELVAVLQQHPLRAMQLFLKKPM